MWHGETVLGGAGEPPFRIGQGHHGLVGHSRPGSAVLGMVAKARWGGHREDRVIRPRATTRAAVCRQRCGAELGLALEKLRLIEGGVLVVEEEGEVLLRGAAGEHMEWNWRRRWSRSDEGKLRGEGELGVGSYC